MARTLDESVVLELAERLESATATRRPIAPLTSVHTGMTATDAYAVQETITRRRVASGERVLGWKLGLTSAAMQDQLGVAQPDYGPVLSGWVVEDGGTVSVADLIQPRIEAEIAFVIAGRLAGPGVTTADVLAATAAIAPALEVIDSRIRDWSIRLADTIADLASTARVIVGHTRTPIGDGIEPRTIEVVLDRDAEPIESGLGAAALGDPLAAVAWAANTLGPLGASIEPGQVVMTGALHASVPIRGGETYRATAAGLGSVGVSIV